MGICAGLFAALPAGYGLGLRIVETESIPMGVYATHKLDSDEQTLGAYVCLSATDPHAPWQLRAAVQSGRAPQRWKYQPLMKRVVGVAGDELSYADGQGVRVNGVLLAHSVALSVDSYGNPLPRPSFPRTLERGQVWLSSEHPRGFDSRYFGPVSVRALSCAGTPLWTF